MISTNALLFKWIANNIQIVEYIDLIPILVCRNDRFIRLFSKFYRELKKKKFRSTAAVSWLIATEVNRAIHLSINYISRKFLMVLVSVSK